MQFPGQLDLNNLFGGYNTSVNHPDEWLPSSSQNVCPTVDYGSGIIGFYCTDELFITSLSQFESKNKIVINSIISFPDSNVPNGYYGYVVTFAKHNEREDNITLKNIDGSDIATKESLYADKL